MLARDGPYIEKRQLLRKKFLFCRPLRLLKKAFAGVKKSLGRQNFARLWPVRSARCIFLRVRVCNVLFLYPSKRQNTFENPLILGNERIHKTKNC